MVFCADGSEGPSWQIFQSKKFVESTRKTEATESEAALETKLMKIAKMKLRVEKKRVDN